MKKSEIRELPHEEIVKLSLKKDKKGNATTEARMAQEILWEEGGQCYGNFNKSTKRYDWANRTSKEI